MAFFKMCCLFFIGAFSINVKSYNPMLTYVGRITKITAYPNVTWNYSVDNYKGKYYVNGNMSIISNKQIDKILKIWTGNLHILFLDVVIVVFERCAPEGINCEYFQSWTLTDICPKLLDQNQIWSSWYGRAFDPPIVCPLNKVIYQVRNGTFDIQPMIKLYTDTTNYYWKLTQKLYSGNTFVGSYKMEATFLGYRKRNKHP